MLASLAGDSDGYGGLIAGGGIMIVGAGTTGLVGPIFARQANDEKTTVFQTYDSALRSRLGLCEAGGQVGPCEPQLQPSAPAVTPVQSAQLGPRLSSF